MFVSGRLDEVREVKTTENNPNSEAKIHFDIAVMAKAYQTIDLQIKESRIKL